VRKAINSVSILLLANLLWGAVLVQPPVPAPQPQVVTVPVRAPESDTVRNQQLRALVEASEKALEDEDEETATARSDEADVLTADWPPELLNQPEIQGLLQRLKEVQEQLTEEGAPEVEPGLKVPQEVISISGDELRTELERVRAAEQGATYDFPIDLNDKVLTWVSLFTTTKRGFMENALGRASMYLPMIRQIFTEEGVPADLAYLAVIESGFRNEAKSRAKAVGMWQFIRSTGRIYGLNGNAWVEERRDPMKATRSAARYLKRLYELSGDWYLAASSYNAGPLTLDRAIQNLGTRNFWDLSRSRWLRTETKNYVPELCAAILVGRNPERYGLHIVPLVPYAYETVTVSSMTSLSVLARCANTEAATLKVLNPELLRGSTPPGAYQLRVPPGKAMDCLRQLAHMPAGKRLDFKTYVVRKGDTLTKIARHYKLSPEDLLAANDLTAKQIRPGRRLLVPPPPSMAVEEIDLARGTEPVKVLGDHPLPPLPPVPGDLDLPVVAPESTEANLSIRPEVRSRPEPSTPVKSVPLVLAPPVIQEPLVTILHAQPGDTLARLARIHQVALGDLMRLNPEAVKALHPGDEVRLPVKGATSRPASSAKIHRVQKGETLASIARHYSVEPADLRAWNLLKGDRIKVGQSLKVRVP
jgi:membrane-bound lytic murein transglycosylase D